MMWDWDGGPGAWGWLLMAVMMTFMWAPLLLIFLWAVREFTRRERDRALRPDEQPREPGATELARRSYARGEINRERYLEIMEDLREGAYQRPLGDAAPARAKSASD